MSEREKLKIAEIAGRLLDIPADAIGKIAKITITGRGEVFLEEHRGLCEYTSEKIVVKMDKKTKMSVCGQELSLIGMTSSEMRIEGIIDKIEYSAEEE